MTSASEQFFTRGQHSIVKRNIGLEYALSGVVLLPCFAWKCVPTAVSGGVDISEHPVYHLL